MQVDEGKEKVLELGNTLCSIRTEAKWLLSVAREMELFHNSKGISTMIYDQYSSVSQTTVSIWIRCFLDPVSIFKRQNIRCKMYGLRLQLYISSSINGD